MNQFLTPYDIINNIRMTKSMFKGSFLVVEGTTDAKIYENLINSNNCNIITALGKTNVLAIVDLIDTCMIKGVLAIVDSDFSKLDGLTPNSENLLFTDTHDLETMIINSPSFNKITNEFVVKEKVPQETSFLEILLNNGAYLGYLRWLSSDKKQNLALKFKNLYFDNFIDKETISVDIDKLINEIEKNTTNFNADKEKLKKEVLELINKKEHNLFDVCCGHDLVEIFAIAVQDAYGNRKSRGITYELLDGMIRLSYEYIYFLETDLGKSVKKWEEKSNYKILK